MDNDISKGLIPVGKKSPAQGTPYEDGRADGSTSRQDSLYYYNGKDVTPTFSVSAENDEILALHAVDFPDGAVARLELVIGKGSGTIFTPVKLNGKQVQISTDTVQIAVPYSGRYRLNFVDGWPEGASVMELRQQRVEDALQAYLPQFDFQTASEVPFSPEGVGPCIPITAGDVQGAIAQLAAFVCDNASRNTAFRIEGTEVFLDQTNGDTVSFDLADMLSAYDVTLEENSPGVFTLKKGGDVLGEWTEGAAYTDNGDGTVTVRPADGSGPYTFVQTVWDFVNNNNGTYTVRKDGQSYLVIDTRASALPSVPPAGAPAGIDTVQKFIDWIVTQLGSGVSFVDNNNNSFTITIDGTPTTWGVTIPDGGSDVSFVDLNNGTYRVTIDGTPHIIDTRAPSNPFNSAGFVASTYNGSPIDNVYEALMALGELMSGLLGGDDFVILNNPTLYVREATGNDNNDGSTPALAFKTYDGLLDYINNAYIIGNITIDSIRSETKRYIWKPEDFKGAGKVTLRPGGGNPANLVFTWGQSTDRFDHGLVIADGLVFEIEGATWVGGGVSQFAVAVAVRDGADLTLSGRHRFAGVVNSAQWLLEATGKARLTTPRSSGNQPSTIYDIDLNAGQTMDSFAISRSEGKIQFVDCQIVLRRNIALDEYVIKAETGGSFFLEEGPGAADSYEPRVLGPGNFVGKTYSLRGTGAYIEAVRVNALSYGNEATYWRATDGTRYNGIGTFTSYGGVVRHGNQGTYHA